MPDPVPNPVPSETPAETPPQPHEIVAKADLAELALTRSLALTAQDAQYAALMTEQEVAPADLQQMVTDANNAEEKLAPAVVVAHTEWRDVSRTERTAFKPLWTFTISLQGAAKRKFMGNDAKLSGYCIAKKGLGDNREVFEKDLQAMLDMAATDQLKGFPQARLAEGADLLEAWQNADDVQKVAADKLGKARATFKKMVASLKTRRVDLQLAVNNGKPHTDPDNATVRRAFKIPANRQYRPDVTKEPAV